MHVLPVRPSLESLRKQAKKLARDVAAGNADAVARARAQLPHTELPLSRRDAQLVLAREYGFAGWKDLTEEVLKRTGQGAEWAAAQAERAIHDNDVERLKQLLAEYPALLSWRDDSGGSLLSAAAISFGDSGDAYREQMFTRPACAELLIDAGAVVDPLIWKSVISSRAKGMLQLLWNKGVLPRTLMTLVALGDLDGVRACLDESGALRAGPGNADGLDTVNEAFLCACRWQHKAVASFLLERCIALNADLGRRIDAWQGRSAFIDYLGEHPQEFGSPWQTFVMNEVLRSLHEDDLSAFARWLQREPYLLSEASVGLQVRLIEIATYNNADGSSPSSSISMPRCGTVARRRSRRPSTSRSSTETPISFRCSRASEGRTDGRLSGCGRAATERGTTMIIKVISHSQFATKTRNHT